MHKHKYLSCPVHLKLETGESVCLSISLTVDKQFRMHLI